jgi:TATA-binding protein-associated factor Taf7
MALAPAGALLFERRESGKGTETRCFNVLNGRHSVLHIAATRYALPVVKLTCEEQSNVRLDSRFRHHDDSR